MAPLDDFLAANPELMAHSRYASAVEKEADVPFLAANPGVKVSVEGHADERGAREYNIGLGDHRAQSVRRMLELQGVAAEQVSTVSYGEEKPAVEGHDESAWAMNRRVELVYVGY